MPRAVVTTPSPHASARAMRRLDVSRTAAAAGPMSSAVDRMEPTAIEESPTDTAIAIMKSCPTRRRFTPRARASSALTELISSGRKIRAMTTRVAALITSTSGTVDASTLKIDPKRICWVAPVVAPFVVSR